MTEYLVPNVYTLEDNSGPRPIEGVGTAMAAFVGFAEEGPANIPVLVTNWSQYVEIFAGTEPGGQRTPFMTGAYLGQAVFGYFNNGGTRCYITRVVSQSGRKALHPEKLAVALPARASKGVSSLMMAPKEGITGEVVVEVLAPSSDDAGEGAFNLRIKLDLQEELFEDMVVGRPSKGSKATAVAEAVQTRSKLVTLIEDKSATGMSLAERAPELGSYTLKSAQDMQASSVRSGNFVGDVNERSGIEGLEIADDATMICAPDLMSAYQNGLIDRTGVKAVQQAMITHCERMADRMAILDPLPELSPLEVKKWRLEGANYDSKFAALYYPWIVVNGPDGKPLAVPPCGHMAGIWARTDRERGVHKAPANEVIRGALEPSKVLTNGEQELLNPIGVNCIRAFSGRGVRVWGARTLSSDPAWRYINVRRLFNYCMKSIERGTQWAVFEPNDVNLWERIKRDTRAFLTGVWRDGALFGRTPEEAFFVKCDDELNPEDVRDRGILNVMVGISPVKPAEFIVFRFSQKTENAIE